MCVVLGYMYLEFIYTLLLCFYLELNVVNSSSANVSGVSERYYKFTYYKLFSFYKVPYFFQDEWGVDSGALAKLKEQYKKEIKRKKDKKRKSKLIFSATSMYTF